MLKFLVILLALSLQFTSGLSSTPKFSPGIFYEEESGQILYEATAPIIYQFQVPEWNNFLGLEIENCRDTPGYTEYCKIFDIFQSIATDIQLATTSSSFPEETSQSTWGLKCNYLSQHFSSLKVDASIVEKYLGFLRACSKGVILEEDLNTEYSSKPLLNLFENAKEIFQSDFLEKVDPNGDEVVHKSIALNYYSSLLSTGFSSFVAEAMRWDSAISTCKSSLIPNSLITPTMFLNSLKRLNETGSANGWSFSVQPDPQFLPLYFKAPLADCTFSGDKLIVRILIPIKKSNRQWTHLSAQVIPFYKKVSNLSELLYTTQDNMEGQGSFFYEKISKRLFNSKDCDTSRPGFCRLPQLWDQTLVTSRSCVWNLLQDERAKNRTEDCSGVGIQDIRNVRVMPLVVKQGTDIFYMTGFPEMALVVECSEFDGSVVEREFKFPQERGTLEVRLPCFCKIVTQGVEYESQAPCQVLSHELSVTELWHQDFVSTIRKFNKKMTG